MEKEKYVKTMTKVGEIGGAGAGIAAAVVGGAALFAPGALAVIAGVSAIVGSKAVSKVTSTVAKEIAEKMIK